MEEKIRRLEKRMADLEEEVQNQPKKFEEGLKNAIANIRISSNEKSTQKSIKAKFKYSNKFQIVINLLLFILIIALTFELIRRNILLDEMQEQLNKLQQLMSRF